MNETRRLTPDDLEKGYTVLACGCHAQVFSAALALLIDPTNYEYCHLFTGFGKTTASSAPWGVRLSHIQALIERQQ